MLKINFSALMLSVFIVFSSAAFAEWHSDTQGIMGTEISATVWHEDPQTAKSAIEAVMAEMRRIDQSFSPYIPSSELSQANQNAFKRTQILSEELAFLVQKSLYVSDLSSGAFDITFASLARYYDYRKKIQPEAAQRQSVMPAFNYRWLEFDATQRSLKYTHEHVQIDLGGIAKGHAVDRAIALLQARGFQHASVSAGGDSRVLGDARGRPWVIGIKNPRANPNNPEEAVIRLPLEDVAISTSGDYERFFIDESSGERVHHILNPRTGKSAGQVMSVTVLGDLGVDTDPLSTAVFVLGVQQGLKLVNRFPGFDAIIIDINGKVHYSNGLISGD